MKFLPDIDEEIAIFFKSPPREGPGEGSPYSVLYLLRRDLRDLAGHEDLPPNRDLLKAPVLASFGIMSGLELLARVWLRENDPKQDPQLIKAYQEILSVSSNMAKLMIHFRNAIGHGYQLAIHARDKKEYCFSLNEILNNFDWFAETKANGEIVYSINFWELRKRFIAAIHRIHGLLVDPNSETLRANFYVMRNYLKPYLITT